MVRAWLGEIEFSDNSVIQFDKDDIVVFVGPNNAGKSASLRESYRFVTENDRGSVVNRVKLERQGDANDLISFLESISKKQNKEALTFYVGYRFDLPESSAKRHWAHPKGLHDLAPIFANLVTTEARLGAANPPESVNFVKVAMQHPVHHLYRDDRIESKFSEYFKQAFGKDLMVHRGAGSQVPLYVGDKPALAAGQDRVSADYILEMEKRDLLHQQGDGMRAFLGVLLNAFIANHSMLFIDEPEAFLHPPQARLLGTMLAKDLPAGRQLFLATHSEAFLKGLLDANAKNLKIIRIQREGTVNKTSVLDSSQIELLWKDSLLRHSNILDGLFHSKVIICESDADCRFFSAVLDSLYENTTEINPDVLFVQCGGKYRVPTVVKALRNLNVPLKAVCDIDVLNDENPLKEIFQDLGGQWLEIEKDWKLVKDSIDKKRPELEAEELKKEIDGIFNSTSDKIFPKNKISEIQKALRKASAWSHAKDVGKQFIPSGDATKAFERLQAKLKEKGLMIPEVGELESFVKSVGNHGPKWVNEVLSKNLKTDPELGAARAFVKELIQ